MAHIWLKNFTVLTHCLPDKVHYRICIVFGCGIFDLTCHHMRNCAVSRYMKSSTFSCLKNKLIKNVFALERSCCVCASPAIGVRY